MGKKATIWLVIAISLILIGCILFVGAMEKMHWNFANLSTNKFITTEHQIQDSFTGISIEADTADITFLSASDGICKLICQESAKETHSVTVENGTLKIRLINNKAWYDYIGIGTQGPKLAIYLPGSEYGELVIQENTGDITIPDDFTFESMKLRATTGEINNFANVSKDLLIETDTGAIHLENVSAAAIELSVSTGRVTADHILCNENFTLKVSTGKANLSNIQCQNLVTSGNTGNISLTNVVAAKTFTILRSTGNVKLNGCDAETIHIETSTGDVTGSLLTDKLFSALTDTGKIRIPSTTSGGNCVIITNTGNINIIISTS